MSNIYTKTGDKGTSSLFGGARFAKSELVFEVLGDVDELNAALGHIVHTDKASEFAEIISNIQNDLFYVGSCIAMPKPTDSFYPLVQKKTRETEVLIDKYTALVEPLFNFVLPSGSETSSWLHTSRAICRRTERHLVKYMLKKRNPELKHVVAYINRLSDLLFVLARYANKQAGHMDLVWKPVIS